MFDSIVIEESCGTCGSFMISGAGWLFSCSNNGILCYGVGSVVRRLAAWLSG